MSPKILREIQQHAREEYPRECCGLIVAINNKERYLRCDNLALGKDSFEMSSESYVNASDQGEVKALVHSHPDASAVASEADKLACEASGLIWHIIALNSTEFGELRTIRPCGYISPLVGRPFLHGSHDCYTIIKDYYEREKGIILLDFDREDEWWYKGQNLYMDNFEKAGFTPLTKDESIEPGDVVLMQLKSSVVNHAGVFLGNSVLKESPDLFPVPDAMLHHVYGRLSERVVYGGQWRERTNLIIRYRK